MRATIEVKTGLEIGRRFDVVPGPDLVFGHSERVLGFIPHDTGLDQFHFSVRWEGHRVQLTALSTEFQTFVNGEPVREAVLKEGDRIHAGNTSFEVRDLVVGAVPALSEEETVVWSPEDEKAGAVPGTEPGPETEDDRTGPELLEWLGLSEAAQELAEPGRTAGELLPEFLERGDWPVSVRLQAHLLTPRAATWWGWLCLHHVFGDDPPEKERLGLAAARAWLADPSEENRRAAEEWGPGSRMKGLACWLCTAAFWSGGSMAPEELPEVLPDRRLTGAAVSALLHLAAPYADPALAAERYARFLALGPEVRDGAHPFPDAVEV